MPIPNPLSRRWLKPTLLLAMSGLMVGTLPAQEPPPTEPDPADDPALRAEALNAMGYAMAQQLRLQIGFDDNELAHIFAGMRDAATEQPEPEDFQSKIQLAQTIYRAKMEAFQEVENQRQEAEAAKNSAEAEAFLAELDKDPEITKSPSGLRYTILEPGNKEKVATPTGKVKVHYHGTLIDGTVFDSSVERGEPTEFPVNRVVPGFSEGLQLIGEGGKVKLYLPPDLGYGTRVRPGSKFGPNSLLIFDVEILEVMPEEERPTPTGSRMPPKLPPNLKPPPLPPDLKPPPPPPNMRPPAPPPQPQKRDANPES